MTDYTLREVFPVDRMDFIRAGEVSSSIKRVLRQLGVDAGVIRRIAIACYEAEMNLVIHSEGGEMQMAIAPDRVLLVSKDRGPGIRNIDQAMTEGYSTASEDVRQMGFGAGMGLPNIRRNCDGFQIESKLGVGTTISMSFDLNATG